jgi:hypothetical protein
MKLVTSTCAAICPEGKRLAQQHLCQARRDEPCVNASATPVPQWAPRYPAYGAKECVL